MLRRYSNAVLELSADDGIRLLLFAFEKENEEKLFTLWVGSNLCLEESFETFKARMQPVNINEQKTLERIDYLMSSTEWVKG